MKSKTKQRAAELYWYLQLMADRLSYKETKRSAKHAEALSAALIAFSEANEWVNEYAPKPDDDDFTERVLRSVE